MSLPGCPICGGRPAIFKTIGENFYIGCTGNPRCIDTDRQGQPIERTSAQKPVPGPFGDPLVSHCTFHVGLWRSLENAQRYGWGLWANTIREIQARPPAVPDGNLQAKIDQIQQQIGNRD